MGVIRYGRTAQIGVYPGNQSGRFISYRQKGGGRFSDDPDTTLAWEFARDKSLTDLKAGLTLTHTRVGPAWYFDQAGAIQQAAANEARFDHDPITLRSLGLLIEPTPSTNLFLNSTAPVTQSIAVTNGQTYTVWMLGTGSVALGDAGSGTATQGNPVTFTAGSANLNCTVSGAVTFTQVEQNGQPTSPIVTAGAAVTRNTETCVLNNATWYNEPEGTILCECYDYYPLTQGFAAQIDSGSDSNRHAFGQTGVPTTANMFVLRTNIQSQFTAAGKFGVGNLVKMALSYKVNDFDGAIDGVNLGNDPSGNVPLNIAGLRFGNNFGGSVPWDSHISSFGYAEVKKDAAYLERITA